MQDGGTINRVQLTIPFEGNARLFNHAPKGLTGRRDRETVNIVDDDGRWGDDVEHTIKFTAEFPAGASADHVRRWAKGQADYVETILNYNQRLVDEFNSAIRARVVSWMQSRREVLSSADTLQEKLGRGI